MNIPAINPSARSAELSWSFYKKFLRTVLANGFQARAMADLIEYFHWNYGIDSNGTFLRTAWCLSIQHQTFCIGQVEYITPTNYERRLKTVVERLKRAVHSSCFYPPSPYSICKSFESSIKFYFAVQHCICHVLALLLSVSILLVKTMKPIKAFQITSAANCLKKICLSTSGQVMSLFLLTLAEVLMAIIWAEVDSPSTKEFVIITCSP